MAADVPSPEASDVPKGPETQGDPVLIEAEEALRRASEAETTALDLREKGLRVTLIDASLKKVNEKIATEKGKAPEKRDNDKLSRLVEKKVSLEKARTEIMAIPDAKADEKIAKVEATLESHASELEGRLKEIDRVQARIEVVQTEISKYESATDQEGQLKYSAALKEMGELTTALAALEKEGTEEQQRAQHEATLAAEKKAAAMREQEHAKEVETAEKGLSEFEENPDKGKKGPENPDEEADANKKPEEDKPKGTSSEGEEEKAARKRELLHNALHKVAYGLAVDLEKNYPGADGNAYEKMEWNGKAFLLKIVVMFGGTPKWAELVKDNPTLSEFLEKKVGMTFTQEDVKKDGVSTGEKRWAVKWEKPVEGWEPGIVEMADVFETAYGDKDEAGKAMGEIEETTTLKEMKDKLPSSAVEEKDKQTERLIKAMEDAGATGETKVQEFLTNTQNAKEVQKNLKPTEASTVAESPREPSQLLKDLDEIPPSSPETIREHVVRDLLPALTDSTLTFTADTPLIDAWAAMLKPADLTPEKEAKWAADITLFKSMASGEGASVSKDMLERVKDNPYQGELLATSLVIVDAMSAEEAHAIIQDAVDGSLDESSMASLGKAMDKMLTNLAQAFGGKTLGQALNEFKPRDDAEKAKVEEAKQRINGEETTPSIKELVIDQTTFKLVTDEESAKALAEQGIKFTGKSMVDVDDGNTLRDFGDANTVEFKSLGNNMFTLTATTLSIPSSTPGRIPSGEKIESVTFQGMDSLVKPQEAPQT